MTDSLTILEQREVPFYEDTLTAVRLTDEQIYVSIPQMCRSLGIDTQAQRRRMERHTILSNGLRGVANLATPGGTQSGYVLRVDLVPLWLSGIRTKAVKEEIRPKLERFQQEAARVLWDAFRSGELTVGNDDIDELLKNAHPETLEAYQIARSVYHLARRQLINEARLNDHETRLQLLEARAGDEGRYIDNRQAAQIAQAVKAVALEIGKRSGRNEFGGVYGELYRRFDIAEYRALPRRPLRRSNEVPR